MKRELLLLAAATAFLLTGCGNPGDDVPVSSSITAETPNGFLRYINTQASLAAGDYTIVAATAAPGQVDNYVLTITHDDGTVDTVHGSWSSSGGPSATAPGNRGHALVMDHAGGVKIALHSVTDTYLYLVHNGRVVAEDDNGGGGTDSLIDLAVSKISSVAYANAYYAAVDPADERTTLTGYLQKNCFIDGPNSAVDCAGETIGMGTHVVFRDSKDLGYGRNMYARHNNNGTIAFFVSNYVIKLQAGSSSNYGPVNVEAAVREDKTYHVGTNAIEFSPMDPNDPSSEKITKFFTFNPAGDRITSADLDGRGVKHMPQMCWVCHGGRLMPLDKNGDFPLLSLRSAKYNQLEIDSFEYSSLPGWSRSDQESAFKILNGYVHDSYADMDTNRPDSDANKWYAGFALEISGQRYGGPTLPSPTYVSDYVPPGWQQTAGRPEGVERLYKHVIEPHCVGCHALQGNNAGEVYSGQPYAAAINFSSWEKFYAYRDVVADYVFRRGAMPLSLRNWEDFWRDPQDKPALLASFLGDATLFDANHRVVQPGNPVARPGADRHVPSPVQLDGTASSFAQTYRWTLVSSPVGSTATLDDATSARPVFTADTDGDYVLSLVVGNDRGNSPAENLVVTIDGATPQGSTLTFVDDIAPILGSVTGSNCAACHNASGGYPGIPVYWKAADNANLYRDVLARVNFADPENSLLLMKPTTERHGGGQYLNLATLADQATYNTILEWIRAGAPCGYDATLLIACD